MLPFGVVIPTKNSMAYLPDHVKSLETWIDLAEQVVVVDSFSKDGTVDFLKKNLRHPNVHFVEHPPGLYASWNHGIRQLTTEYCYISTVGDSLTRAGAEHLVTTAQRLQCDVLVSQPDFVNHIGAPTSGPEWPMVIIGNELGLKKPSRLSSTVMVAAALYHTGGAFTGSCASDLFRTTVLQRFPFPVDFGVAGDGAWCLQNAGRVDWAFTQEKFSTFRRHPPTATAREVKNGENSKYADTATAMVQDWVASRPAGFPAQTIAEIDQLLAASIAYEECQRQYNQYRKSPWPWSLNPMAWGTRGRRNRLKQQAYDLTKKLYAENATEI